MTHNERLATLITGLIEHSETHERWLATLSFLESCGARKIAAYLPKRDVPLILLKHAAEEARHAYFFKKQIAHISQRTDGEYPLLGGYAARHYLHVLDIGISRIVKRNADLTGRPLKDRAYLLTTLTIEERAAILYPLYHRLLKEKRVPISLTSIIKEEDQHLAEIKAEIEKLPDLKPILEDVRQLENQLFEKFIKQVEQEWVKISEEQQAVATK